MRRLRAIASLIFFAMAPCFFALGQEAPRLHAWSLNHFMTNLPEGSFYVTSDNTIVGTNGMCVQWGETVLTADSVTVHSTTGEAVSRGHVHIERSGLIWVGEDVRYNFKTHQMQSTEFRAGNTLVFVQGEQLQGDSSNQVYTARHSYVTTDDVDEPAARVYASRVTIVPGRYVEMRNAVVCLKGVPIFYFPYYRRGLGERSNNFSFQPGDSSSFGPYLLTTYNWFLQDWADGAVHLDYRERRGIGIGPDVNLQLGQWGDAHFKYYYLHDQDSNESTNFLPFFGNMPKNRQRVYFDYQATPATNLDLTALVNYQTDPLVLHDYFQGDYGINPQPNTFVEADKRWSDWSLDAEATPRLNTFFDQVERLPDVKVTGFRQQIFNTPVYYQSESTLGYYRMLFADTNGPEPLDYSAYRGDTYHELLMPHTFFGWLNVTPHAGGRYTYYSNEIGPGGTNGSASREVFDTGIDASFKVSRLWSGATNSLLDLDGLRHVLEPSVSYMYVPRPNVVPSQLPQFDSEIPGLLILPIQFPDYNDIDSIDTQNVVRFGVRNTLQTKRGGQVENFLDWNLLLDWRLRPALGQNSLDDLYSQISFRPRSWITLDSQVRYDINDGLFNTAFHQLTLQPNETWSWGLGYWYARNGFLDSQGANLATSTLFFRLNDNWGLRMQHNFDIQSGRLEQQYYTVYRDFRSWTGALTLRLLRGSTGQEDFGVAFTFSIKARPRTHVGGDTVNPESLIGE